MRHRISVTLSAITRVCLLGAMLLASVGSTVLAEGADPNIVVVLRGDGTLLDEPPVEGALCYPADLIDAGTDRTIGTGIDCLSNITSVGDGFLLDRTTFLHFPEGTLIASGPTTVMPSAGGTPGFSHIVGEIPAPGTNSIDSGTGRFSGATGSVRLSGAVNMGAFPAAIVFNCIFVIDLD